MGSEQGLNTALQTLSGDRCNGHQKPDPPRNPPIQDATNPLVQGGRSVRIVLQDWNRVASAAQTVAPRSYQVLDSAISA